VHVPSGDTRRGAGSTIRWATASRTKALPAAPPPVSPPHRPHVCVHPVAAGGEGSAGGRSHSLSAATTLGTTGSIDRVAPSRIKWPSAAPQPAKRPRGYPEATPRLPRGYPEATPRLPRNPRPEDRRLVRATSRDARRVARVAGRPRHAS